MVSLKDLTKFCDIETRRNEFTDYKGAYNGLQIENNGTVRKIGASVDAGMESFEQAIARGIEFLIVHHGPFWGSVVPLTGPNYRKFKRAFDGNLAVYGSHLPLDAHPEIGNNVLLAKELGLTPIGQFGEFEGKLIGWYTDAPYNRERLVSFLEEKFPKVIALAHGSAKIKRIGIMTGSGGDMMFSLARQGIDTLITGECSQHHFNLSQELGINLILCGHYATEVFAVKALTERTALHFGLEWEFIDTECPL